ncbi:MAG: class I SAM-dependent methyltransferase [Candidatus Bathyarchaeota archaeon]|nr:MAG: class I SAM-dependent methyltransferase [Candidatus Bathyarchaeota archaeon]
MKVSDEEIKIYDNFALDLSQGVDVVDRDTYEVIIDSRRKELIKRWLADKKGLILDYGCGDGSFSRFINVKNKKDVIGVDLSSGIVRYASTKDKNVDYLVVDCHALPFRNESFDGIIAIGIFHHLDLPKAMSECKRLLRRDGFICVFEPNSLCPLSSMGRRFFKTKIHTPNERTYTYWSFINEFKKNKFVQVELLFLSFMGFIFPFIWASNYSRLFAFLKRYTHVLKTIDTFFEKTPIAKHFCWMFVILGMKKSDFDS